MEKCYLLCPIKCYCIHLFKAYRFYWGLPRGSSSQREMGSKSHQLTSFCVYKTVTTVQTPCGVFIPLKEKKEKKSIKKKKKHNKNMVAKTEWKLFHLKENKLVHCRVMQQVYFCINTQHKKVEQKSACVYLCCTQCSCFCCLLLLAKSHPATTWGQQSVP